MKKSYIIILCAILAIILGIFVGIAIGNKGESSELLENSKRKLAEENSLDNEIKLVTTSSIDIKTSPNTVFIFKTYYKDCNHTSIVRESIPENLVNLTREEIAKEYNDWQIENFERGEVTFLNKADGICDEHYVIRDNKGYAAIYNIDSSGKEILKETTDIVISYLPEIDRRELKDGIRVIGKDELNARLEDYE